MKCEITFVVYKLLCHILNAFITIWLFSCTGTYLVHTGLMAEIVWRNTTRVSPSHSLAGAGKWAVRGPCRQAMQCYAYMKTGNNWHDLSMHYLLTFAHCSQWSVGHLWPLAHHHTLFWAALAIPDQLVPCCFRSVSVSCLQLLRGRPLFLFPCGFQVRAWCVVLDAGFLRVYPIQPHFPCSICLATGSCSARSHRSSFRILTCHWIF